MKLINSYGVALEVSTEKGEELLKGAGGYRVADAKSAPAPAADEKPTPRRKTTKTEE